MMTEATEKITATVLDELLMKMSDLDSIVRRLILIVIKSSLRRRTVANFPKGRFNRD